MGWALPCVIFATVITLVLVPAFYLVIEDLKWLVATIIKLIKRIYLYIILDT